MIEREFAGEIRRFELRYPRGWPSSSVGCFETPKMGNLTELADRAGRIALGGDHVRHILAHALAGPDDPVGLLRAQRMVEQEMDGKPLLPFMRIAAEVVVDAFQGI